MKQQKDSLKIDNIASIMKGLGGELGLERGMKMVSLAQMWGKVVGPRFQHTSRIYTIQDNCGFDIIIVAVSSSAVAQELLFYKNDIIKKIYKVAKELELKIKDIQFSTKYWKEENED